jgi:hypothetical protein
MGFRGKIFVLFVLVLALAMITPAFAAEKQKLSDAWWTGPLQTPNAGTIPKNHWYVETYFGVQQNNGGYSQSGTKYGANSVGAGRIAGTTGVAGYSNDYMSTTLFTYGVTNKFNFQMLLAFQGTQGGTGVSSSNGMALGNDGIGAGLRLRTPYKLHSYKEGKWAPTLSIVPEVNTPAAAHRVWEPGMGLWAIRPFWMPNGRILRIRASEDVFFPFSGRTVSNLNSFNSSTGVSTPASALSATCLANTVCKADKAVYGFTQVGLEYSLTKHWVPAFDFVFVYTGTNQIGTVGAAKSANYTYNPTTGVAVPYNGARVFEVDPALEYNFTENTGVIFGAAVSVTGRNYPSYIQPMIALQWFK